MADAAPEPRALRLLYGGVAVLSAVAAAWGLLVPGLYTGEAATAEMLRGYDLVTLAVAPVLLLLQLVRPRAVASRLVSLGLLSYLAYTYAYYLFGTGFNDALLLHAVVFSGSLVGLVLGLTRIDITEVAAALDHRTRVRVPALVLALLASSLGVMWAFYSVRYAVTGEVPMGSTLVETDLVVHLGIVLDLTILVPAYAAAALLLWWRRPWGYVLGVMLLVSGLLHQVSYLVALLFQSAAGVPDAVAFDPVEPVILLLYAGAATLLLRGLRRRGR
jgi:hypothetical protein